MKRKSKEQSVLEKKRGKIEHTTPAEESTVNAAAATPTKSFFQATINLMWINRISNPEQLYIYPSKNENDLYENFLNHIFKWAAVSKGSIVNVWYDSALISAIAVDNTSRLIEAYMHECPEVAPIVLRDIRTITKVIQHQDIFTEKIPVFFRVDLLRLIIALHILANYETNCFVYADLDMEPLSQEQIFDEKTWQNLQAYGIVMAVNPCGLGPNSFENGFQIISNHNLHLLEAIDWAIIEVNIHRAQRALVGKLFIPYERHCPMHHLVEVIYKSYYAMWDYFCFLEGWGKLYHRGSYTGYDYDKVYDKETDGLKPFGISVIPQPVPSHLAFARNGSTPVPFIPVKKVAIPETNISEYYLKEPLFDHSSKNYIAYAVKERPSQYSDADDL